MKTDDLSREVFGCAGYPDNPKTEKRRIGWNRTPLRETASLPGTGAIKYMNRR